MNASKAAALLLLAGTVTVVGYRAAHAQGAAACFNQPNMNNALNELRNARGALERAAENKGGWRVAALRWTDKAIVETERGCAFANTH